MYQSCCYHHLWLFHVSTCQNCQFILIHNVSVMLLSPFMTFSCINISELSAYMNSPCISHVIIIIYDFSMCQSVHHHQFMWYLHVRTVSGFSMYQWCQLYQFNCLNTVKLAKNVVMYDKRILESHKVKNINIGVIFVSCNYKENQSDHKQKGFLL